MIYTISDLIESGRTIDQRLRMMSREPEFERLIYNYSLYLDDLCGYELRESTAYLKCHRDRIEIYHVPLSSKLANKIATVKIFNNGTFELETYIHEQISDQELFILHLSKILK